MRNRIRILGVLLIVLCLFSRCQEVRKKKHLAHKISFYYRLDGHNGDYLSYTDNLIYANYKNGELTAKELFLVAKHYVDTIKTDAPVGEVNLAGLGEDESLPKSGMTNMFKQRKYFVIEFLFSNGLKKFAGQPIWLIGIIIWKSEKAHYFYQPKQVDSVLNSPIALNNEQ